MTDEAAVVVGQSAHSLVVALVLREKTEMMRWPVLSDGLVGGLDQGVRCSGQGAVDRLDDGQVQWAPLLLDLRGHHRTHGAHCGPWLHHPVGTMRTTHTT